MTSIKPGPARPGLCTWCDAPSREKMDFFPAGHQRAGEPMRMGGISPGARITEFMLSDGSTMSVLLCAECAAALKPAMYGPIMRRIIESWEEQLSDARRAVLNVKAWPDERKRSYREKFYGLWIVGMLWKTRRDGNKLKIAQDHEDEH